MSRGEKRPAGARPEPWRPPARARPIDHTGSTVPGTSRRRCSRTPRSSTGTISAPGAEPAANRRLLSIVPEFGCPYQQDALALPGFAALHKDDSPAEILPHLDLQPRAAAAMRAFIGNTGGCSFCVFRFQDFTLLDTERTVEILMAQVRHLERAVGVREFSIQTENPLRLLRPFLERLAADRIPVERLAIRTMATILLAKADELRRALALARAHGTQIVLQQIGFESFDQEQLDRFNKGISVADNRRAARLLAELKAEFGETLEPFSGTGSSSSIPGPHPNHSGETWAPSPPMRPSFCPRSGCSRSSSSTIRSIPSSGSHRRRGSSSPRRTITDGTSASPTRAPRTSCRWCWRSIDICGNASPPAARRTSTATPTRSRAAAIAGSRPSSSRRALASYLAHGADAAAQRQEFFVLARWVDAVLERRRLNRRHMMVARSSDVGAAPPALAADRREVGVEPA